MMYNIKITKKVPIPKIIEIPSHQHQEWPYRKSHNNFNTHIKDINVECCGPEAVIHNMVKEEKTKRKQYTVKEAFLKKIVKTS